MSFDSNFTKNIQFFHEFSIFLICKSSPISLKIFPMNSTTSNWPSTNFILSKKTYFGVSFRFYTKYSKSSPFWAILDHVKKKSSIDGFEAWSVSFWKIGIFLRQFWDAKYWFKTKLRTPEEVLRHECWLWKIEIALDSLAS